jgi:aldehyde:ferredoxin oxidoreductase
LTQGAWQEETISEEQVKTWLLGSGFATKLACDWQNYAGVYNPIRLCKFLIKGKVGPAQLAEIVNSALVWEWTPEDVLTMGDKLFQLKRLINLRLAITAADDVLPERLVTEPRPSGHAEGILPDMELMLPVYYELRAWDENGVPRRERLEKLGLV